MPKSYGLSQKDKIILSAKKSRQSELELRGYHLIEVPENILVYPFTTNLKSLDLSYNNLQELTPEVNILKNLEALHLSNNSLSSLPSTLEDLAFLKRIGLSRNKFKEIPEVVEKLENIEWVNFNGNEVEHLPCSILRLPFLKELYLIRNPLVNIPKQVCRTGVEGMREFFGVQAREKRGKEDISLRNEDSEYECTGTYQKSLARRRLAFGDKSPSLNSLESSDMTEIDAEEPHVVCKFAARFTDNCKNEVENSSCSSRYEEKIRELKRLHREQLELINRQKEGIYQRQNSPVRRGSWEYSPSPRKNRSFPDWSMLKNSHCPHCQCHEQWNLLCRFSTSEYGTGSNCSLDENSNHSNDATLTGIECTEFVEENARNNDQPVEQCNANILTELGAVSSECSSEISSPENLSPRLLPTDNHCCESSEDSLTRKHHLTCGNACAVIPGQNLSGHVLSEFHMELVEDVNYSPQCDNRSILASQVFLMEPHGAKFFKLDPALIRIPFDVRWDPHQDQVLCMCSDTGLGEKTKWKRMRKHEYKVFTSHVEIKAHHFSFYTVIVKKLYPEAHKKIRAGIGGHLNVDDVPGVEVIFPETALLYDIDASIRVLYGDPPYNMPHYQGQFALATPVVELGPHGCQFNQDSPDQVTVRLPLPHGREIMENYSGQRLSLWQSLTKDREPLNWEQLETDYEINVDENGLYSVYFKVMHFTFFKALWDILDAVLYEAKLGASFYCPVFQFYVTCQVLMTDHKKDKAFGLCFLCYRFGKPMEGVSNYPLHVGCSGPRKIKTGQIIIRIDSKKIEADLDIISTESLKKIEQFIGRPFEKQFLCKFSDVVIEYGLFGKVFVERQQEDGNIELLFEFNLEKPRERNGGISNSSWEVQLTKELAGLLSIQPERDMGDEVWEDIARSLGYTEFEISTFRKTEEPLTEVVGHYKSRGGRPDEFLKALYRTGYREGQNGTNCHDRFRVESNSFEASSSHSSHQDEKCLCMRENKLKRKRSTSQDIPAEDTLFTLSEKVLDKWKGLARFLRVGETKIQEIERDFQKEGVHEQCYQMFLTWKELYPDNSTLGCLATALNKLGKRDLARQYCFTYYG